MKKVRQGRGSHEESLPGMSGTAGTRWLRQVVVLRLKKSGLGFGRGVDELKGKKSNNEKHIGPYCR
jgi:hypothetical protein